MLGIVFIYIMDNIIYNMQIYHYEDLQKLKTDDCDKVITISISGYITNIHNTPIFKCNNLTALNIQCAKIPTFILDSTFHSLKQLSLCRCNLTTLSINLLDLSKLEHLNLSANNLKKIPKEIYNLSNLRSLWLDSNFLIKISKKIKKLTKLTSLRIQNNKLNIFPSKIYKLTNLEELFHNNIIDKRISLLYNLKYIGNIGKSEYDGNIYVHKDCMLIYNYYKSPKFIIEVGDSSYNLTTKLDNYTKLYGRNKIMIEIPSNIKFLNIIKTNLDYVDFNKLPEELEYLQIKSNSTKIFEFNNYPCTLKKLSLINNDSEGIDNSDCTSYSKIKKLNSKLKVPFGCELIIR